MFIDYKVCIWKRMYIPEGNEEIVLEKLKEGNTPNDLFYDEEINSLENFISEYIYNSEYDFPLVDNANLPTIEVYEDIECIWTNQIKNNEKD